MPLTLEIVTPEARVYSETVDSVNIPTVDGEVGILPGHIPLVTQVDHGELRVTKGTTTQFLAVGGGFAQVSGDKVSILADSAIHDIHSVRVRNTDAGEIVNFHCHAAPSMSVIEVHENVDEIERALRRAFPAVKRVISHAEPPDAQ